MTALRGLFAALLLLVQRLLVLLPWRLQQALGAGLGRVMEHVVTRRRDVADRTLSLAMSDLDREQRLALRHQHFRELGIGLMQIGLAWWAGDQRLARLVDIEGLEHLGSVQDNVPTLLVSGHFTTLDLVARGISLFAPVGSLYRPLGEPVTDRVTRWRRERFLDTLIDKAEPRALFAAMRESRTVWLAVDQADTTRTAIRVPFFGQPALTSTTANKLAERFDARIVPVHCFRNAKGRIQIRIEPPLTDFGRDAAEDAAHLNQIIERHVRVAPAQYFWVHDRFKALSA